MQTIRTFGCEGYLESTLEGTPLCELNLPKAAHAWYDETTQGIDKSPFAWESAISHKKVRADCRLASSIMVNLSNGRSCSQHSNCFSKNCKNGICKGLAIGELCSQHADCDAGSYCKKDRTWPYVSRCNKANTNYEQCNEDFECGNSAYCWYVSKQDRIDDVKKCLPLYSQEVGTSMGWYSSSFTNITYEDYEINGRYCKSGLAFPVNETANLKNNTNGSKELILGNCTATDRVFYTGKNVTWPYSCNPYNQTAKCLLFYNASAPNDALVLEQKSFSVRCNCALNGNDGYCSKLLGTTKYKDAMAKRKTVLEASECHTLDRNNFRSQRDTCGIGPGGALDDAINAMFEVNYHAWVQDGNIRECIEQVFDDSLKNQSKLNGKVLTLSLFVIYSLIAALYM